MKGFDCKEQPRRTREEGLQETKKQDTLKQTRMKGLPETKNQDTHRAPRKQQARAAGWTLRAPLKRKAGKLRTLAQEEDKRKEDSSKELSQDTDIPIISIWVNSLIMELLQDLPKQIMSSPLDSPTDAEPAASALDRALEEQLLAPTAQEKEKAPDSPVLSEPATMAESRTSVPPSTTASKKLLLDFEKFLVCEVVGRAVFMLHQQDPVRSPDVTTAAATSTAPPDIEYPLIGEFAGEISIAPLPPSAEEREQAPDCHAAGDQGTMAENQTPVPPSHTASDGLLLDSEQLLVQEVVGRPVLVTQQHSSDSQLPCSHSNVPHEEPGTAQLNACPGHSHPGSETPLGPPWVVGSRQELALARPAPHLQLSASPAGTTPRAARRRQGLFRRTAKALRRALRALFHLRRR